MKYAKHPPDLKIAVLEFQRRLNFYATEAHSDTMPEKYREYWTRCAQALKEEFDFTVGKSLGGESFDVSEEILQNNGERN